MAHFSPARMRWRLPGRWSIQSLRNTTAFAPTDATVGDSKRLTRSLLQTVPGTTPSARRRRNDESAMTIRISECRNALLTFAAFAVLFDQGTAGPVKAQNLSSAPDVHLIVHSSIAATQRYWQVRLHYTYLERDENRRRDSAGRMKSENVDVSRTILVNGIPFDQLVEHNGRALSAREERAQKKELDKV